MQCHECGKSMRELECRPGKHGAMHWFDCPACGATCVKSQFQLEEQSFSLEPFDNYLAAKRYKAEELDDADHFRLRAPKGPY